jgi:pSer/pThr/pTyr-binding forkhead associated (FHA) protein
MESGQILPLSERNEYILGRVSEGQPVVPDLDLSPYQAYATGVSRMHALLKRDGKRVIIVDLGSANGTYVNGKRLMANVERLLNHGDVVALGKFKFQVLIR